MVVVTIFIEMVEGFIVTTYFGRDGKTRYELDKQLKSGGEGVVFTIKGNQHSVAKIYKPERIADEHIRNTTKNKILAMLDMRFDPFYNGRVIVAWPEDALFDINRNFYGFVMPKIKNMKSLIWATRPSDRDALWPNGYRWHYSLAIAFNLSLTIERIHKAHTVVGDLNTNNILIDAAGNVTLIDSDSFNVTTQTGQEYKCIVGFPEVLPAELQGKDLTKPTSHFTEATDCFSLAVHVFNLLCNNCHPFGCLNLNNAHGSSSNPKIMDNIIKGYCPYVNGTVKQRVDDALDMDVFPKDIRNLFDRAFNYDAATAVKKSTIDKRPTANEWRIALGNLYKDGVTCCKKNDLHEYPSAYQGGCPWCAIEKRKHLSNPKVPILNSIKNQQLVSNVMMQTSQNGLSNIGQSAGHNRAKTYNTQFKKMVVIGICIILLLVGIIAVLASIENANTHTYEQNALVDTQEQVSGKWLVDMERIDADNFDDRFNMSYNKNDGGFSNVITGPGNVTFPLNGLYSSLTAVWEVKSDGRADYDFAPSGALQIYTDGYLAYSSPYITCNGNNSDYIYIDVSGCSYLQIYFNTYEVQSGWMGFIDTNTGYLSQVRVEP